MVASGGGPFLGDMHGGLVLCCCCHLSLGVTKRGTQLAARPLPAQSPIMVPMAWHFVAEISLYGHAGDSSDKPILPPLPGSLWI